MKMSIWIIKYMDFSSIILLNLTNIYTEILQ